jgi:protein TonB
VNVTYPELILATRALPEYPPLARQVRAEGRVVLQVVVDRTGVIDEIEVLSSPRPDFGFTVAAREAVRQWRYHPARQQQRPVDVYLTVVVEFSLD